MHVYVLGTDHGPNLLQGYHKAGMSAEGLDMLRLGNNYLLKTIAKAKGSTAKDPEFLLAYQVRVPRQVDSSVLCLLSCLRKSTL